MLKTTVFQKICFSLFLILALSFVFCEKEENKEMKVTEKEIPQAVLKAFTAQYPGEAVREYSKESEEGKAFFEISFDHEGRTIDLLYNANGEVVESEETILPQDMPGEIQKAIAGEIPQFSLRRIEKVQKEGKITFEAVVLDTKDNNTYEMAFSDSGKLIDKKIMKQEEKEEKEENKEEDKEEKVTEKEIPQAVLKAFTAQYPGAAVREYSEESEEGKEFFEISFDHEGKTITLLYNTNGEAVESEETILPQDMPGEIQKAIAGEIPQFSLQRIEKVQKGGKITFEAVVLDTKDNNKYEMVFSDSAKLIDKKIMKQKEEKEEDEKEEKDEE